MVTQQTPAKGIYVHLTPQLHRGPNENCLEGPIVIRLTGQNEKSRMLVNGKELRREELEPFLKAALARRANWEVFIEGDDSVSYADPMYAIDVINALHAKAVILTPKLKGQIGDNCR